jgi:hypothetical protein
MTYGLCSSEQSDESFSILKIWIENKPLPNILVNGVGPRRRLSLRVELIADTRYHPAE